MNDDSSRALQVHIGEVGHHVGMLRFRGDGSRQTSSFEYADSWLGRVDAFELSPELPLGEGAYYFKKTANALAFAPSISDTCPDAWGQAIIRRDGKHTRSGRMINDLDYLSGVDDAIRFGALRFKDGTGPFIRERSEGRPVVPALLDLEDIVKASRAVERNDETAQDLRRLIGIGSSIGGAQPKCAVKDTNGDLMIAKFRPRDSKLPVTKAEVTTLQLAEMAGLHVAETRLITIAKTGDHAALIKRFDRGKIGRIHAISAQTMLGADTADSSSYRDIADAIRVSSSDARLNLHELFNRMAYTVLVSNTDDHLKNHSFVYTSGNEWSLSKMYDVNPAPERSRSVKTELTRGSGEVSSIEALLDKPEDFDLTISEARATVKRIATVISANWRIMAEKNGMSAREIKSYEPAFDHDEARKALALTVSSRPSGKSSPGIGE